MSRRLGLVLIILVLLVAALLRIGGLTRVPPGFNDEEIVNIHIAETVRTGIIASFYNVGDPGGGREGLYPILQALFMGFLGDGLLSYRALAVCCGLLSVALMYALARRLFGRMAGLIAALTLATSLWPILLARSAIRETLLLPLFLAILLILARALHLRRTVEPDPPTTLTYAILGVLIAAAGYTHWTGLLAGPLVVLFIIYLIATRQTISRRVIGFGGFALLVALILAIPYLTFTLRAYRLSGLYIFWANRPEGVGPFINTALQTLASPVVTGDPSAMHNLPGHALIGPVGALFFLVGLGLAVGRWRSPNMMLMLLTLGIGLLPGVWSRSAPDFANTVLALPALAGLAGYGGWFIFQRLQENSRLGLRPQTAFNLVFITTIAISVLVNADLLMRAWANNEQTQMLYRARLGNLAAYLDRSHDGLSTSICSFHLADERQNGTSDPILLNLMLHRRDLDLRFSNCLTGLVLTRGGEPQRLAFVEPDTQTGLSPFLKEWLEAATPVDAFGVPPGAVMRLMVQSKLADRIGLLLREPVAWDADPIDPSDKAALPIRMGGYLTFEGYTLDAQRTYRSGESIDLITYWRADGNQIPDLRIFAHILRNPNVEPALQNDILSIEPRLLRDRDIFIQIITIPLPAGFPPGEYLVSVGAYSEQTGERVPVYDGDRERGNRLFLKTITVRE